MFAAMLVSAWIGASPPREPSAQGALVLRWEAPSGCPEEAAVRDQLASYLTPGQPLRTVEAHGVIEAVDEGWSLRLEVDGQVKVLRSSSCEELGRAAALVLSIAIVPEDLPEQLAPQEPEENEPVPLPPDEPPVAEPEVAPPVRERSLRGGLRIEAAIRYGITPTLSGASMVASLAWPRARAEVAGLFLTPGDGTNRRGAGQRELVTYGGAEGRGCAVLRARGLVFPFCAGLQLGAVRLDDITDTRVVRHGLFVGASAQASLVWPFRRWAALWFGPGVTVALRRPRFELAGDGGTYVAGPVGVRGALGIEFQFP